jgi:ketopantoate hydroxymethyltransferase
LTSKLTKMKIPVIIHSNNNFKMENNDYLELMHSKLVESESQGAVMILVDNYPQSFVQNLKGSTQIPVISNVKSNNKVDGYYVRFSSVFGLIENEGNKYLNLSELIRDGINDYIGDNK